jgi:hypothetical protein
MRGLARATAFALAALAAGAAAGEPADFGQSALRRAQASYAAGDTAAAHLHVMEATDTLVTAAQTMHAPGSGEVLMLVNDLRLLRISAGSEKAGTEHDLGEARTRAGVLAARYPAIPDVTAPVSKRAP